MKKIKYILPLALFLALTVLLLAVAQAILVPHDPAANPEAFLMKDYLCADDTADDQVVFLGDCEVYEAFSPAVLWQEYGISARVCGTPQQLLWHSYATLCEVFERSSPQVVVLSVYGLVYGEPQSEAYARMALEHLPDSSAKWQVISETLGEDENALSYLLPLLRYHDRWDELTTRDVTALFEPYAPVSVRGYLVQTDTVPGDAPSHEGGRYSDTAFGPLALEYFDRIVSLCRENGAELVLVKAPTDSWRYPWFEEYEDRTVALAQQYGLTYYNLLNDFEAIGLDFATDTYDGGYHLNVSGAEKLTFYFGKILSENYSLSGGRTDPARVAAWADDLARYEELKQKGASQ